MRQSIQAILLEKKLVLYLLLGKNLAIASCTKALEVRNDKCFQRVTEEGYKILENPTLGRLLVKGEFYGANIYSAEFGVN
ncbi:hypothetical protein [Nostoc sp. UHCC 0252]|uniref:hypothetical protein n=1 Tax=Nostoc sp. UHCC 0252 TaxID=3110241 RepID=UPI002B1ED75B|nr:hypothetical protein [Nostoc sp. UHCC 0252]MEA5603130.1 hypothetical protein [Nostoc sp. UHCC 0252]